MVDTQWAQIRPGRRLSWHIWETWTRVPGRGRSLCNRNLDGDTLQDRRPAGERTCELCLRANVGDTGPREPDMGPFGDAGAAPI